MQGICIDPGETVTLTEGESYYLFPNGESHFYVSKFNNKNAHFGCYRAKHFDLISSLWPEEPESVLPDVKKGEFYKAKLIWRREGYKFIELKQYILQISKTHAHFYEDESLSKYRGCYPLHWFEDYKPIQIDSKPEAEQESPEIEEEPTNFEQLVLF